MCVCVSSINQILRMARGDVMMQTACLSVHSCTDTETDTGTDTDTDTDNQRERESLPDERTILSLFVHVRSLVMLTTKIPASPPLFSPHPLTSLCARVRMTAKFCILISFL